MKIGTGEPSLLERLFEVVGNLAEDGFHADVPIYTNDYLSLFYTGDRLEEGDLKLLLHLLNVMTTDNERYVYVGQGDYRSIVGGEKNNKWEDDLYRSLNRLNRSVICIERPQRALSSGNKRTASINYYRFLSAFAAEENGSDNFGYRVTVCDQCVLFRFRRAVAELEN